MSYSSLCSCGKVTIEVILPRPIEEYAPRRCDCDFCTSRGASYLSDPEGKLKFLPIHELEQIKQGSYQATFWSCSSCKDLVAVTGEFPEGIRGAANSRLFEKQYNLQPSKIVSPKTLSPEEKLNRWCTLWMKVEVNSYNGK